MTVRQSNGTTGASVGTISAPFFVPPLAGNILVCTVASANNGALTGPSGWNTLFNATSGTTPSGANELWGVFWKVAGSSEPVTVSASLSVSGRWSMVVVELPNTGLDTSTLSASVSSSAPTAAGFTSGAADTVLAIFAGPPTADRTPTWNDGFASEINVQASNATNGAGLYLATKDVATATATGTVTCTLGQVANWRGVQVGFSGTGTTSAPIDAVSSEYVEVLASPGSTQRAVSSEYIEVLALIYPPPIESDTTLPSGITLKAAGPSIPSTTTLPSGISLKAGAPLLESDTTMPTGALGLFAPSLQSTTTMPANLTLVHPGRNLEEVYVEAITEVDGTTKLGQLYVEAATSKKANARLDQVYVEVLYSVTITPGGWRGWGIKL